MATEPPPPETVLRAYRMRVRCNPAQRHVLIEHWFGAARAAYNLMVDGLRNEHCKADKGVVNDLCRESAQPQPFGNVPWVRDNPCAPPPATWKQYRCIYKNAMLDAVAAEEGNRTKLKKNPRHTWTLKFRSRRRDPTEVVRLDAAKYRTDPVTKAPDRTRPPQDSGPVLRIEGVPETAGQEYQRARLYLGKGMKDLGPVEVRDRRRILEPLVARGHCDHESKLLWDKRRRAIYWVVLLDRSPRPTAVDDADPDPRNQRVVAMDPGTRRFQTWYDPATGGYGELLAGHRPRAAGPVRPMLEALERRCWRIDRAQSRWQRRRSDPQWFQRRREYYNRPSALTRPPDRALRRWAHRRAHGLYRRSRRRWQRDLARLDGFKHDMHYAAAGYLWDRWDVVIATTASFGDMARRDRRPFGSRTARRALNWGHYRFRQRLQSSAALRTGKQVIETGEEYTSRTCGRCGTQNHRLGGAEVFRCVNPACWVRVDRDVNAARNIALRVLTDRLAPQRRTPRPSVGACPMAVDGE